jgi:glutaredoxin
MRSRSAAWPRRRSRVASTRRVTLYHAPGCHLCESARRVLGNMREEVLFELEEIDISADPELERRYRERIPVVAVDGEEAFTFFVHPDGLRRRLGR